MKTAIAIVLLILLTGSYVYINSQETVQIKVVDKERVITNDSSKYLVFGEDEVFENTDSTLFLKWNSSDVYRDLNPGETYQVRVAGWRVKPLSMYRNIIEVL